ncbi:hypothetical protein CUMW_262940 [Citrus unshiu]|uniref:Uncharacterized protein n=1 Tax=Citrus unshiu TaxID=55188 RepID=A0A2H5QUI5_CITUN|nr:hypothetical protein CUMW_262940 [Citrus unshiu]
MLTAILKGLHFYLMILRNESLLMNCFPTSIPSPTMCILHSKETQQNKLVLLLIT